MSRKQGNLKDREETEAKLNCCRLFLHPTERKSRRIGGKTKGKVKQDFLCQLPFLAFLFGPVVTAGRRFKCIKLFKNLQDHEIILYLLALWQGEFANWLMRRTFIMETSDTLAFRVKSFHLTLTKRTSKRFCIPRISHRFKKHS